MISKSSPSIIRIITISALLLILNGCALIQPDVTRANIASVKSNLQEHIIGPFPHFSGRLIVIQPAKRWQVAIDWHAPQANAGLLRLSHAITGIVIDFRWDDESMEIRDNKFPYWRTIGQDELSEHGLVLPPDQLASILLAQIPPHYHKIKAATWESTDSGNLIRLRWQANISTLTISDVQHGRTAKLIIK